MVKTFWILWRYTTIQLRNVDLIGSLWDVVFDKNVYHRWVQLDKVRNAVLKRAGIERELFDVIKKRTFAYLGHILRGNRHKILQLTIQGKIERKRRIGSKQLSQLRNIKQWTGRNNTGDWCHHPMTRWWTLR